ncbi:unnamed protein product [Cuscuta epithymum]|uniref:catechol oxidase n=1 Tax=Cuscuta epithymum TaxID=186058 RepID=A0AAV0E6W5_9ASTE|nr:unnamed protein product [Cuscuta epithymum]
MACVSFFSSTTTTPNVSHFAPQTRRRLHVVACNGNAAGEEKRHLDAGGCKFDRRNMLVGLGGLYGYGALTNPLAFAEPISAWKCGPAQLPKYVDQSLNCCPPLTGGEANIVDFKFPRGPTTMRVRPAAHVAADDEAYVDKFTRAVDLMKALPDDDPRSFRQQANIHCAYCNGGYNQGGFPEQEFQIHSSWLFFPFHRCYLYFFERILGKLIDDPTFAMPFWNWDHPAGMTMPAMYTQDPKSPLYNSFRDAKHQPPNIVDLDWNGTDKDMLSNEELVSYNLTTMYRTMVSLGRTTSKFYGSPYRAGDEPNPGAGSLELSPHSSVHFWTGDRTQPLGEDMGSFYAAGRDMLFYAHHGNIDRMWCVWKNLGGGHRRDFCDPDWLDTSFIFYDENAQMVRIKVRDCLDSKDLGYVFQDVEIPWTNYRPTPRVSRVLRTKNKLSRDRMTGQGGFMLIWHPGTLDKVVKAMVRRPIRKKKRSQKYMGDANENKEEEETLLIEGIELEKDIFVKFDVLINDESVSATPMDTEFAGSFVSVPHGGHHKHDRKIIKTNLRLSLNELLEDLGVDADNDECVLVTIVPRAGCEAVKIGSVKIVLEDD